MRVALTKGTLWVPPTYFAVQHALAMPDIDWHVFDLVSDIQDPAVTLPVTDGVPHVPGLSRRGREHLKWLALGRMSREVGQWDPDLIHQHAATWSLPAVRASRRAGIPLVTTLHGGDAYVPVRGRGTASSTVLQAPSTAPRAGIATRAGRAWTARNLEAATEQSRVVLAVSHHLAGIAMASGVPAAKLEVHYQGVDTDFFTPSPSSPLATPHPGRGNGGQDPEGAARTGIVRSVDDLRTVLFVGALSPLKGIRELLAVSEDLAPFLPHRLRVVGAGPLAPEVGSAAQRLDHVTVVGALGRDAVRDEMRAADVLVLPTRHVAGRAEAAGLVLLEAQACGTPVLANAVGGTPEMMVDGTTGFATDEDDLASLRSALRRVLSMPGDELAAMGTRARDWVVAERSLARSVAELRSIYRNLVDDASM